MSSQGSIGRVSELTAESALPRPVNVASVPHRSPFRYPGGKTWFVPTFRRWVAALPRRPRVLVEPFAGGGIISLTAIFENLVDQVVMVELDDDVAAVWETSLSGDVEWLVQRILTFPMTRDAVAAELQQPPATRQAQAFQTILKNRTVYGGILADGARFVRCGERGKGIGSRWYPKTLAQRLLGLRQVAPRIDFRHADGMQVLREFMGRTDAIYFIDPPYTAGGKKAGRRLYKQHQIDHDGLFALCTALVGDFLMTYDVADEVQAMVRKYGLQLRTIPMKNTHHAAMQEFVIGRDLSWLDARDAVSPAQSENVVHT